MPKEKSSFEWTRRRKIAVKGILAAVATFPLIIWALYSYWPVSYAAFQQIEVVMLALQSLSVVALFCFFMFTRTARLFDVPAAEDVLAGESGTESPRWQKNSRIYRNTVEQGVTFAFALLALATVVAPEQAQIVPVLAVSWLFGRIAFYVAYHIDPAYRAFGFDYTLFPSSVALGWFFAVTFAIV